MAWPQIDDFRNAILTAANLKDEELGTGRVVTNKLGLPMPWAGGIAIAYKIETTTRNWAVRTFKGETDHLATYNMISSFMNTLPMWSQARKYFAKFEYLQRGIDVPPYRTDPLNPYPVVKMEWVDGRRLDQWVRDNLGRSETLKESAGRWVEMIASLFNEGLAHGDLQQGNVLVLDSGDLKLIDYDGMFVPAMQKQRARELGHPNWNHPARNDSAFGDFLDQFTGLVGYVSILALATKPELFEQYNNGDNLIFKRSDLRDPRGSSLFRDLMKLTRTSDGGLSIAELAENLAAWSQAAIDSMTLNDAITKKHATVGLGTVYVGTRIEIVVQTDPCGAMVKIDGTAYGQTNDKNGRLKVSVRPDIVKFEIVAPGYESLAQTIDIRKAREGDIYPFKLTKAATADVLVIKTKPLGAEVRVENDVYGLTIPEGLLVPKTGLPDIVHIEIHRPGYRDVDERVPIGKADRLDFVLESFRSTRSLTTWFLSGLFGSLLTLIVLFQVMLLVGGGFEMLPRYWGAFAFCSGAVGLLIYALLPSQGIKGALILLVTSTLTLVLGSPEFLLSAFGWHLPSFLRVPSALIGQFHGLGDLFPGADTWNSAYLLKMLAFRYLGFAAGIFSGWRLGSRFNVHIQPFPGLAICVAVGFLLPAALLFRVAGLEAAAKVHGMGPVAEVLILWVMPAVLLGLSSAFVLRFLPVLGHVPPRRPWLSVPVVGASYCYFIASAFMFSLMGTGSVSLTLTTVPSEVKVYRDTLDKPLGVTDKSGRLTVPVEPGKAVFLLRKNGFKPSSVEFDVKKGKHASLPAVELTRIECNLRIKTDPGNVSVYVGGNFLGKSDPSGRLVLKKMIVESPVDITFRKDGYREAAVRFDRCCPKEECRVTPPGLTRLEGKLRVAANTPFAQVLVTNGQNQQLLRMQTDGRGNALLSNLPLNRSLKVAVKKDGFKEQSAPVKFSPADLEQKRSFHLVPLSASLVLKTVPARVKVYVGSRFVGESGGNNRLTVKDIPVAKPQTLRLQKEGFTEKTVQFEIPPAYGGKVFDYGEVRLAKVGRSAVSGIRHKEKDTASSTRSHRDGRDPIARLRERALKGHAPSQNNYAAALLRGEQVPKDEAKAVKWFRKAAEQGNPTAQYNLGRMYKSGTGVPQDYAKALQWFRRAAEKGNASAQNILGVMYAQGKGVPKDHVRAARYYFQSAEKGNMSAEYNLGLAYLHGRGVAKDRDEAVNWFRRAAKKGHERSRKELEQLERAGRR